EEARPREREGVLARGRCRAARAATADARARCGHPPSLNGGRAAPQRGSAPLIEQPERGETPRNGAPMAYTVPPLPYAYDALEPHIDKATMEFHHNKHHQAYVDKVNAALEGTPLADAAIEDVLKDLSQVPDAKRGAVKNNGGGHYNHTLFWENMSP